MAEFTMEQLAKLLTMSQVAELKNVAVNVVRRSAKNDEIPGKVEVLGKIGFDPDLVASWTPPVTAARTVREDGRHKFGVWATDEEAVELAELGFEMIDTRAAGKARRVARKAAEAGTEDVEEETEASDGPFADFDA